MYNNEVINFTRVKLIMFNETTYQFNRQFNLSELLLLTMVNPSLMDVMEEDAAEGSATRCRRLFADQRINRTITIKNLQS